MTLSYIPSDTNAEGILKAAASGVLPNGKPVVVNADGTVSVVAEDSRDRAVGSTTIAVSSAADFYRSAYDANAQKVILVYRDEQNQYRAKAVVGTVSGTSISFGTPVEFGPGSRADWPAVTYDANAQKIVVAYSPSANSYYGYARVGTVNGTTISFGNATVFHSSNTDYTSITYDATAQKVVIAFRDAGGNNYGMAIVGTVSGTSISFGSYINFATTNVQGITVVHDTTAQKNVVFYKNASLRAKVLTVSGTSISAGAETDTALGVTSDFINATYDASSQRVVVVFANNENDTTAGIVGTVSGTSISLGSAVSFQTGQLTSAGLGHLPLAVTYGQKSQKIVVICRNVSNSNYGTVYVGTVSGTSISFESGVVINSVVTDTCSATYDVNSESAVLFYRNDNSADRAEAVVFQPAYTFPNLTAENYIGMSSGPASPSGFGTSVVFETGAVDDIGSAYDSTNNRHVIAYQDEGNSNQGTAAVATVSGSTVSFGTPVVFETGSTSYVSPVFDSTNNKVVIFYIDAGNSGYLTAIVGTVSGTAISFGTAVVVDSTNSAFPHAVFDSTNGKIVCHYAANNGYGIVGTISGTSISFGTRVEINGGTTQYMDSTYDSNAGKVVANYRDAANSNNGNARVGTVSGTSISYGTEATFNSGNTEGRCSVFDPTTNKIAIFYKDAADSDKGKIVVGTVSGTNISFGSEVEVTTGYMFTTNGAITVNSSGKLAMVYQDGGNSNYGTFRDGTISGTTVTLDTAQVYSEVNSQHNVISYNSTEDRMLVAYSDVGGNDQGVGQVYDVGFAGEVASGGAARIDIIGSLSTNQGGLTAGQSYFVQTDGTIGLTADDPSVFAGTAISATKLIVKT